MYIVNVLIFQDTKIEKKTIAPIGAWEVKLLALLGNFDRPTNQPTERPTTD